MRFPRATYRLQLHAGFDFDAAASLANYLAQLGISHVYVSPILQPAPGSSHGYDVADPAYLSSELGGAAAFERFRAALRTAGLGLVVDVVPNHMDVASTRNRWWWDLLRSGPQAAYADYFDVDWEPPEPRLGQRLLLPILGDVYGRVLESGQIRLARDDAVLTVRAYDDHVLPVSPQSEGELLAEAARQTSDDELMFLADALAHLPAALPVTPARAAHAPTSNAQQQSPVSQPPPHALAECAPEAHSRDADAKAGAASRNRRFRDLHQIHRHLQRHLAATPTAAAALDAVLQRYNEDLQCLHQLLERQHYRLAFWRAGRFDLTHRRFFDIDNLVALRTDRPHVFDAVHARILALVESGHIDGLRVDHPDGLRDPEQYFRRLRAAAPAVWTVAEKILHPGEQLPNSWPIEGTTGYDFLHAVDGLFVHPQAEKAFSELYAARTGADADFAETARHAKRLILDEVLGSDLRRLGELGIRLCESNPYHRDFTRPDLSAALREVIAWLPVYRTYTSTAGPPRQADVELIEYSVRHARQSRADLDAALFDWLEALLTGHQQGPLAADFVCRWEQLAAATAAKGIEDTAYYRHHRLVSLNEVGGDPSHFGHDLETFHAFCERLQRDWPHSMLTTSTHDTKRSLDVRMRQAVLTEMPEQWQRTTRAWDEHVAKHRSRAGPDANTIYLVYQTLVGGWPMRLERLLAYMQKAVREAKQHTSWTQQDPEYEDALARFLTNITNDGQFVAALEAFLPDVIHHGQRSSLSATLLHLTAPGIPDIYQGCELWRENLTDPDNRRPVDFARRQALLETMPSVGCEQVLQHWDSGHPKQWVIRQALAVRERHPEAFGARSSYTPLYAEGARRAHVVAFVRGNRVVTVAPRWTYRLAGDWQSTQALLPPGRWHNVMTAETFPGGATQIAALLARFPVALLERLG